MSVVYRKDDTVLVNHKNYISDIYSNVKESSDYLSYKVLPQLFCITSENKAKKSALKRSSNYNTIIEETAIISQRLNDFIINVPNSTKMEILYWNVCDTNAVRDLSRQLFQATTFEHRGISGGNNSSESLKCKVKDEYFLIPPNCRFFCGDVVENCKKLSGVKFDVLIADPPWWNKYIRRLKAADCKLSYSMMYNEEIASIPVKELLSENCLVAMWCTNSPANISAVKDVIFPKWGVKYSATWYWLKVKTSLEPICGFSAGCGKQPYERILLGTVGNVKGIPDEEVVVSVPSALHSHKPPLMELLRPYVESENPQTLELFARYLLPNTTSVGHEPLKWQHMSLYESVT